MDSKLVGHLLLVLKAKENLPRRSLLGQLCAIHGKGRQPVLKTESGVALVPLTEECEQEEGSVDQNVADAPLEEVGADGVVAEVLGSAAGGLAEGHLSPSKRKHPGNKQGSAKKSKLEGAKSPRSVGGGGKKKKEGQAKSGTKAPQKEGLLQHIHSLAAKERLHIPACVAEVLDVPATNGSVPLVLVCMDVYVPVDIWAGRRDWRGGVSAIAVLSHLRCDWEARVQLLEAMERVVEGGSNAPQSGVGTGPRTGEADAVTDECGDRARAKGKWKVDTWRESELITPGPLNKPAGALVIREPGTNPEPNHATTQPNLTLADAPLLTKALSRKSLSLEGVQRLVGACQSLGCGLHPSPPQDKEKHRRFQDEKRARFNLPTLFRSLPSHLDELEGLLSRTTTYMLPGGAPAGTGLCDLPDEVLILIMEKLGAAELQRMEAVCRHTRALGAALFPSITLPLFQHQRAAARWMIARERSPSTFPNPLFRCLTSEDGFALWVNLVTGEVSPEDPPPVLDGKGGLICDEPGMGKTATSLAVIMKTRGVRAVGPSEYPKWFCKFEGMADGQAGYYVLPGNALVRHSGSANRSSRSRQSVKLAPETPNAELPRGRLMSDLKAASEPVMGKREREERSGLEGVRRALFSEGGGGEGEKQTDAVVDFEEVGRMGFKAEVEGGVGAGSDSRKRGQDVTEFPSVSADAVAPVWGDDAPAVSCPLKEEPWTPPRIAREENEAETSAAKRRRTEGAGRDEAGERVRTPEGLVRDWVRRETKGLGFNGVDEGFKSVRFLDELDQAGEEAWGWDDVDEGCNRVRSLSDLGDNSNAERGTGWRSNGVDQGFKAVRSLSAVVSSGVRKGNVKHQRGESNLTVGKRSGKESPLCREECGQNGGLRAEIVFGEEPGLPCQSFRGAKSEKARAKQAKRVKLRELAEVLQRMESLEERRRHFAQIGLSNGGQCCGTDTESTGLGTETGSKGGSGLQQRECGLSENHDEPGIDSDGSRSFGRFSDGPVGHETNVGCETAEVDTERYSRLNDGLNSRDDGGKGNSFPGLGQSEPALDELPIDLRTPERPSNAPDGSPSPFGSPDQEPVWQPRRHTAPEELKKVASLLDSAEREGERRPHHRRGSPSNNSDSEGGRSDAGEERADAAWRSADAARISLDGGRPNSDVAWGSLEPARGNLDVVRVSSDIARGSSEAARGSSDGARGCLDASRRISDTARGSLDAVPRHLGAGAGRPDIKAEHLDSNVRRADDFGNGSDDDGKETDAESEGQLESEWVECEACHKWRRLPPGCPRPPEDSPWFCSMNKDPLRQDCSAPSEDVVENEWSSSHPGFVAPGDPPGSAENVAYFLESLRSQLSALQNSWRAAQWLADLKPEDLEKLAAPTGLMVPYYRRDANDRYMSVYRALGLEQCLRRDPPPAEGIPLGSEGKLKRWEREQRRKAEADRARSHFWRYPRHIRAGWTLDTAALKAALATPVEDARRIYLSKATLVVVPSNLIQHWLSQIRKHLPPGQLKVHVWDGNEATSPSAHKLAWEYDVVLTTFSRLSVEWANKVDSTLMHVHWLRLILDEGHTLGSSFQVTNKLQMTIALRADMRWVLTGTPTPNTPNSQVAHLHPLLKFLHEGCYGEQQKVWEAAIQKPFEAQREEGRLRLEELLRRTMISATKEDMRTIPECHRKLVMLEFTSGHAKSYNELVGTVKRNLLLADWNDPNHVESLLNPKQWKLARNTVDNVRKSCCVAGNMMVEDTPGEIEETMETLVVAPARADHIRSALKSGGHCDRCSAWSRLPFITPCAHLLCIACVSISATHCTVGECYKPYKMQLKGWRPENPSPRGPVPQDLIELQPSYTQAEWNPDWQNTQSSKLTYLKRCIQEMLASNAALLAKLASEEVDPALSRGDVSRGEGNASASWQTLKPTKAPTMWPTGPVSKPGAARESPDRRPEKAIVFSEFLEYLTLVEAQLAAAGVESAAMYSPKTQGMKMHALRRFIESPTCCVLVMDSTAAVGLDLSFVSRVYLMEPIWDKSLEEQIVSRAWRMGATRPVMVETLAMRGTIEEEMVQVLQSQEEYSGKSHRETQELNARISCLSRLSPVGLPDSRK